MVPWLISQCYWWLMVLGNRLSFKTHDAMPKWHQEIGTSGDWFQPSVLFNFSYSSHCYAVPTRMRRMLQVFLQCFILVHSVAESSLRLCQVPFFQMSTLVPVVLGFPVENQSRSLNMSPGLASSRPVSYLSSRFFLCPL